MPTVSELVAALEAELLVAPGQPRRIKEGDQEMVLNSIEQLMRLYDSLRAQKQAATRGGLQIHQLKGSAPRS